VLELSGTTQLLFSLIDDTCLISAASLSYSQHQRNTSVPLWCRQNHLLLFRLQPLKHSAPVHCIQFNGDERRWRMFRTQQLLCRPVLIRCKCDRLRLVTNTMSAITDVVFLEWSNQVVLSRMHRMPLLPFSELSLISITALSSLSLRNLALLMLATTAFGYT